VTAVHDVAVWVARWASHRRTHALGRVPQEGYRYPDRDAGESYDSAANGHLEEYAPVQAPRRTRRPTRSQRRTVGSWRPLNRPSPHRPTPPVWLGDESYEPDNTAAASGRWTKNSPLDSARTVEVFVCPASSSNTRSVNGDRNKIPSAACATNPPRLAGNIAA